MSEEEQRLLLASEQLACDTLKNQSTQNNSSAYSE